MVSDITVTKKYVRVITHKMNNVKRKRRSTKMIAGLTALLKFKWYSYSSLSCALEVKEKSVRIFIAKTTEGEKD